MSSLLLPTLPEPTISEHLGTRYLHLGTAWVQGAMQIRKPDHLVLEYVQRMMAWLLFVPSAQWSRGQAVQLGLGAASLTKYCLRQLRMRTTAVELNPAVRNTALLWFDLPLPQSSAGRFALEVMDAGQWLADAAPHSVSALMVDLYDHEAEAPVLDTPEFYAQCRRVLEQGGAMTVNLFGHRANFSRSLRRISAVFEQVWQFERTKDGNIIVVAVASSQVPDAAILKLRAASVVQNTALPARKWLKALRYHAGQ
jgi:spermidine synthase